MRVDVDALLMSSRDGHGNIYVYIYTHTTGDEFLKWLKVLGELIEHTMYSGLIRLILILKVDVDISQTLQLN